MASTDRTHGPEKCHDGDGCKPCRVAESQAQILDLARKRASTVRRPTEAQRRDALSLALRQAGASLAGLLVVLLAGCSPVDPALRRHVEVIERSWPVIRDKSQAAPGVSPDSYQRAVESMDRAVLKAGEAARAD